MVSTFAELSPFNFHSLAHPEPIGELALLPAVRAAAADTLTVADGFFVPRADRAGTWHGTLHLARMVRT